ncbi:MAG: restriction endonuclease subunit S, partial [Fibrobacter sp.]|nr:restriction endonuclease subunit S [Fibrobacter sp.]
MNTKLLKQKILDLAIRGKLTQQLKSDGTAADLLKEIADAKSALSQPKGKKSKDSVQITPLDKNEAPFEIPANWEWIRLGDVCFVTKLAGFEYSDYIVNNLVEDGIPLFKGKNIQDSKLVLQFESYIPENISDSLERSQLRRKCILTPYVGTIGNMAIFDGSFKAHLGSNVGKIEPFNGILEEFLFHFLKSDIGYKQLTKHKKATAQESISIESIRDVFLPLPPLAEQQRIVKKIQEAFAEIDSIENNKELLKTHIKQARQKILDLAIHGKLVPQNKADEPASVLLERITRDNPHYEK